MGQTQEGGPAPNSPYQLDLRPSNGLNVNIPCDNYAQGLRNFNALKPGTTLFDVYAISQPGATPALIGHMVTVGEFTTSKFGDESLFFKHQ